VGQATSVSSKNLILRKIKLVQPKIKFKKVAYFQPLICRCYLATIHHANTTISPSNYHHKTPTFSKDPLKNANKTAKSALTVASIYFLQNPKKWPRPRRPL